MSENTWERDTSGLVAHAKSRKEAKLKQVDEAIATLLREHQVVNFNTVAKAAGVSKVYLYNQPLLRERIDALREQERTHALRQQITHPHGKTDASKDLLILAKDRRIKELALENCRLKEELKGALSKAYDRL
jgi:Family of unknown function (DUF6262)